MILLFFNCAGKNIILLNTNAIKFILKLFSSCLYKILIILKSKTRIQKENNKFLLF